ncbi:MAG: 30S ribosomal protein S6 [Candidatus Omnitrophota bacterium]
MNDYEALFILKPDISEEDTKGLCKTITEVIVKNSGTVKKEENWGRRPLAYPVKKSKEGYYYKVDFNAPAESVAKLDAAYKLNQSILRTLITRR